MNKQILKERIKENFIKNKVLLIVFSVIWIATIVITLSIYKNTIGMESDGLYQTDKVVELTKNTTIEETIPVNSKMKSLCVKYGTYIRKNSGKVFVTIKGNETGKEYVNKTTNVKNMQDNAYITYTFNEELDSKDKNVIVSITSNSEKGKAVCAYYNNDSFFEGSKLKINNREVKGELAIRYLMNNDGYYNFAKSVVIFGIIGLTLVIALLLLVNSKYEYVYLALVIVMGLVFTFMMSPFSVPDEGNHYEITLEMSNKLMFRKYNEIDETYINYDSFPDHTNASYSYNRFIRDIDKPLELKNRKFDLIERRNNLEALDYTLYYVPQSIGVTIARLLNLNMLKTFYAGRITNLLFYALCVFIAIKNTPVHKLLFGTISCLPIFIQQAASFSYDPFVNGLILVNIAFLFKWLSNNEIISKKDYIIVLITNLLLAPAKVVYGAFALLFFFVPIDRFGNNKKKLLLVSLLCLPTIAMIGYNVLIRVVDIKVYADAIDPSKLVTSASDSESGRLWNPTRIINHPLEAIGLYLRTIRFWLSTWFYHSIGKALAGVTLILPMTLVRIIVVLLLLVSFRKQDYVLPIKIKISFIIVCLIVAMFIITSMLCGWTYIEDTMIQGIQGRYFCPLLPYFFAIFANKKIKLPTKIDKYVIFTQVLVLFEVMMYVLSYTFVN